MAILYKILTFLKTSNKKIKYNFLMLRHRPKLIWDSFFIRKDEFHKSLDMNIDAMLTMNKSDRKNYIYDLVKRRDIAHNRDLESRN